jgi:tetratricopeptide (TPR) repeat protein
MRYELPDEARARIAAGLEAYRQAQLAIAERPESHLNIGLVEMEQGKAAAAQRAYRTALRLDPAFAPAYVNLADLYRALGADGEGEQVLREGIGAAPDDADLHQALGLLLVRTGRLPDAVPELGRAADLAPERPRYAYVHALAVKETGDTAAALAALESALGRHPDDRDLLFALTTINRDAGQRGAALAYARRLAERDPADAEAQQLLRELGNGP